MNSACEQLNYAELQFSKAFQSLPVFPSPEAGFQTLMEILYLNFPGTQEIAKSIADHSRIGKVLGESRGKLCARLGNPIDETHKYVVAVRLLHVLCIRDSTRQPSSHFKSLRVTSGRQMSTDCDRSTAQNETARSQVASR